MTPKLQVSLARLHREASVRSIQPHYLTERDYPWLRGVLEERGRFAGRKRGEWQLRIQDGLSNSAPRRKLSVALRVLDRLARDAVASAVPPRQIRAVLFREAACTADRDRALASAAKLLGVSEQTARDCLFADIAGERLLRPIQPISPEQLALRSNLELVADLLARALRVRLKASGKLAAVVRQAKRMGLLCHVGAAARQYEAELEISGPFALFRHTRIYARALTSLVPCLAGCQSFELEADCVVGPDEGLGRLVLRQGDPIFPTKDLPLLVSKVEERFAAAFAALAPTWQVVREPAALEAADSLIFPDLELRHRETGECWLLEIVGYWTPEYLHQKLAALRSARCDQLIVCIDEERRCSDAPLALDAHVLCYQRKLDPRAVLARIDPRACEERPL